jgi:hypothetical protein
MKRSIFAFALLLAMTGISHTINPITGFQPGTYLGDGSWLADDGATGIYASLIKVRRNGWDTIQYRGGQFHLYESILNIDSHGFFVARVTDSSDPSNPITYMGFGNCGSMQCQLTVIMNNGTMQKTMTFDPANNKFYVIGAIYFNDGTPDVQWEGSAGQIPNALIEAVK